MIQIKLIEDGKELVLAEADLLPVEIESIANDWLRMRRPDASKPTQSERRDALRHLAGEWLGELGRLAQNERLRVLRQAKEAEILAQMKQADDQARLSRVGGNSAVKK